MIVSRITEGAAKASIKKMQSIFQAFGKNYSM
jgi:hypothetical protein